MKRVSATIFKQLIFFHHNVFVLGRATCFLAVIVTLGIGCGKKVLTPTEYVTWIENADNGIRIERTNDRFKYQLQLKPPLYIVIRERTGQLHSLDELAGYAKEFDNLQYFTLKIAQRGEPSSSAESIQHFDADMNYLSYGFQNDIRLIDGCDTLPCILFHHENTGGLTSYDVFSLAFDSSQYPDKDISTKSSLCPNAKKILINSSEHSELNMELSLDGKNLHELKSIQIAF